MIVSCPQCQARYKLDPNKIAARGAKITCPRCRHVFVVYPEVDESGETKGLTTLDRARPSAQGLQEDPTAPVHRVKKPKRSAEDLDFRKVSIASWKVRVKIGLVYDFSDIKTLRKYIQDGRVTPEDVISHNAKDWATIGDIPDLDAYFVEVYDREEDALENGRTGNEFEEDTPTNVVGVGSLGSDLAAQALAEATRADDPSAAPNEHDRRFVDPFAALKDKQRDRIQERRAGGRKAPPPPPKESGGQKGLLLAALVLIVLGGGAWWFLSQDTGPVSATNTTAEDAVAAQKAKAKADAARNAVNEKLQEELEEIDRDDMGGTDDDDDPILIPIVPRGEPTRKSGNDLLSGNSTGTTGGTPAASTDVDFKKDCQDFTRAGSWTQAKMACGMALKDSPGNPAVMVNYGIALYENGELNAASNQLGGAGGNGSTDPRIKKYQGHIAREQGDVMGASGYYQDYLAANPNASDKAKIEALLTQLQGG
ncbi:MAG: hypothetical protein GY913_07460 [Proteobacteria bacterium]|nr:hypothetical protein [Pseudomonadota bacterium]MCP4916747.1 hypothetical protein [Pseudomonadota bacterium]